MTSRRARTFALLLALLLAGAAAAQEEVAPPGDSAAGSAADEPFADEEAADEDDEAEVLDPGPGETPESDPGRDADARDSGIENIVVTSERRESLVQETPIAISAFSGADLDSQGYLDFEDLSMNVPNMQFGRTLVGGGGITIRGVSSGTGDRATAFHVDGIYLNQATAAEGLTFFDLERVEVLRGPQGTLYGRNATGGSINVISAKPGPEFEAFGDFQFGSFDEYLGRAVLNVPLVEDKLFGRVSLLGNIRDGFQRNIVSTRNNDADDAASFGLRSQLRWEPTDDIDVTLRYVYGKRWGIGPAQKILGTFTDAVDIGFPIDIYCTGAFAQAAGCDVTPNPSDNRNIALDFIGSLDIWTHNINLEAGWQVPDSGLFGETEVRLRTSWFQRKFSAQNDQDGSDATRVNTFTSVETSFDRVPNPSPPARPGAPDPLLVTDQGCDPTAFAAGASLSESGCKKGHDKVTEWVAEVQWASAGAENYQWVVGGFFLDSSARTSAFASATVLWFQPSFRTPVFTVAEPTARSYAVFGQGEYSFGTETETIWDDITGSFGLRFTHDRKASTRQTPEVLLGPIVVQDQIDVTSDDPNASDSWNALTGMARAQWHWADAKHVYFQVSRGYKAGEINTALQSGTTSFPNADPETIWSYEIGSKNRFWENRLQANLAWFYYDYKDLQVSQLVDISLVTQNAATASVWGLEGQFTAVPLIGYVAERFDQLKLIVNAGFLHAKFNSFPSCVLPESLDAFGDPATIDCSGNFLTRAPRYTLTAIAEWTYDFGRFGRLTPNTQFYGSGKVYYRPTNCPNAECAANGAFNVDFQDAYWLLDARLTWQSEDDRFEVAAFVKNITDRDVIQSQVTGSRQIGSPIQVRFDAPRTWGVRVGARW